MRVALVYLGRHGSGGPISYELATHLAEKSDVLAVVSQQADNIGLWRESELLVQYVSTYRSVAEAALSVVNQAKLWRIAAQIANAKPDAILFPMFHFWNPFLQLYTSSIPSVVVVHDPIPHPGLFNRISNVWERRSLRRATRCVLLSRAFEGYLRRTGVKGDCIDVVPHGEFSYYQKHYTQPETPSASSECSSTILFFGRITPYKGLEVLLPAFKQVSLQYPSVTLRIVGAGDLTPYRSMLRELKNVEITNRWIAESEITDFCHGATMLVLPYTSATQSGVLAVGASLGLPVIATRVGGLPEQIIDDETGLLVDPGSVEQLAAAMVRLLEEPQIRRYLGRNLYRDFDQNRNWDVIADKFLQILRRAIE